MTQENEHYDAQEFSRIRQTWDWLARQACSEEADLSAEHVHVLAMETAAKQISQMIHDAAESIGHRLNARTESMQAATQSFEQLAQHADRISQIVQCIDERQDRQEREVV